MPKKKKSGFDIGGTFSNLLNTAVSTGAAIGHNYLNEWAYGGKRQTVAERLDQNAAINRINGSGSGDDAGNANRIAHNQPQAQQATYGAPAAAAPSGMSQMTQLAIMGIGFIGLALIIRK